MKRSFLLFSLCTILFAGFAQDLSLEDILKRHFSTTGIDKLQSIRTIIMTGTMVQNDVMPAKIIRARPDQYLMEYDVADITAYVGYDGKTAWFTAPWTGNAKPQDMPEDRARDVRTRADFDGILYHWKEKGHQAELTGRDTVDTEICYNIKVTKSDGGVEFYSIGKDDLLLKKRSFQRISRGKEVTFENRFKDYREVEGIKFPFTIETHFAGQLYNSLQFETIVLDQKTDPAIFHKPAK